MTRTDPLADFRNFLILAWHWLGLPAPNELQLDVAWHLQYGPKKLVLLCFRNFGKSWLLATFSAWCLYMDRDRKILSSSASGERADESTQFILDLIRLIPQLAHLEPGHDQRRSTRAFDVGGCRPALAPSVRSLGISSSTLTGARADRILLDDVESPENSDTIVGRSRLRSRFRQFGGAILTPKPDSGICVLGTPQVEESIYWESRAKGYTVLIYPARYPDEKMREQYGDMLAPIIAERVDKDPSLGGNLGQLNGLPTEPIRFGEKELQARYLEWGHQGFLLQFMLAPVLAQTDRYALKLNDLIVTHCDELVAPERLIWSAERQHEIRDLPCVGFGGQDWYRGPSKTVGDMVPYQRKIMAVDPAGSGRDETAWVVLGVLNSQIHLLDLGGYRHSGRDEDFMALAHVAKRWNCHPVYAEQNYGSGMWAQLFRPHLRAIQPGCGVEDVKVTGRKEKRMIGVLRPVIGAHRLVVDREAIRKDYESALEYGDQAPTYRLFHQMSRVTEDPACLQHDDRLDALSLGVAQLEQGMSRDYEQEIEQRKQDEKWESLRKWDEYMTGKPRRRRGWIMRR